MVQFVEFVTMCNVCFVVVVDYVYDFEESQLSSVCNFVSFPLFSNPKNAIFCTNRICFELVNLSTVGTY